MSRIPLVSVNGQPDAIREFTARRGELNVFRLLANAPDVFLGWAQMVDELSDSDTFIPRTRELVILRVARLQNCRYELAQHIGIARDVGLTDHEISAIVETDDLDAFAGDERVLLDVVSELCTTGRLGDESFTGARNIFGDEGITELLMLIGCYYGLALVLNAVDVEVDGE
jgi:4-carboxymuconolactone decarboxylase